LPKSQNIFSVFMAIFGDTAAWPGVKNGKMRSAFGWVALIENWENSLL